jgi:hypothetical protein
MLRQPSDYLCSPRGEGCSSTAFAVRVNWTSAVWINPAVRGSALVQLTRTAAVP